VLLFYLKQFWALIITFKNQSHMKKIVLSLSFFIVLSTVTHAQITSVTRVRSITNDNRNPPKTDDRFVWFDGFRDHLDAGVGTDLLGVMDIRVYEIFSQIKGKPDLKEWNAAHPDNPSYTFVPKTPILLGVKHTALAGNYTTSHVNVHSKSFIAYKFADKDSATAIAMGINAGNVNDYRVHVTANDSTELVAWSVPKLQQEFGAKEAYAFLGKFNAPGKEIIIEVVNIKNYNIRDEVIFSWPAGSKAVIMGINGFQPHKNDAGVYISSNRKSPYASKFDKITGAPQDFHFPADSFSSLNVFLKNHPNTSYDVYWLHGAGPKRTKEIVRGNLKDSVFYIDKQYFSQPGKYELLISPSGSKDKTKETRIPYKVTSASLTDEKFTILQALPYLGGAFLLLIIYYLYNKRRLRKLDQQKEMANLKLGSVRAQLNPHFMFNALTSIQNLMNQKDSEGANHYLAKFADLTRQVLNATSRELISLEDELKIINDYLQIEQLRFGFNYTVDVDKSINIANTEIPGMLMQPFIENAAKHGISGMADKGKIDIAIAKDQNNLVLVIADNGKGFDTQQTTKGFGLKLGRERVALLNQIYKTQPVDLQINSVTEGTTITITLTGWF
jgi:two-component system LytT family sensor kinase